MAFHVQGPGTLALTASNSYSGGTNVTGGALAVSQDANLGAAGSPLYLDGGTLRRDLAGRWEGDDVNHAPDLLGQRAAPPSISPMPPTSFRSASR